MSGKLLVTGPEVHDGHVHHVDFMAEPKLLEGERVLLLLTRTPISLLRWLGRAAANNGLVTFEQQHGPLTRVSAALNAPEGFEILHAYKIVDQNAVTKVRDLDITINSTVNWSTADSVPSNAFDLQSTVLHEFGHFGVLGHVICPSNSVMKPTLVPGVQKRSPKTCDNIGMGIARISNPCARWTGICIPFLLGAFNASEEDQVVTQRFATHQDELIQIWNGSSALRNASNSVGSYYSDLFADYLAGGTQAFGQTFTTARYNELNSEILTRIYNNGSSSLKNDINVLRTHLQGKTGRTIGGIFIPDTQPRNTNGTPRPDPWDREPPEI